MPPISAAQQLHPAVPSVSATICATSQCRQSAPSISVTHQCRLSVPISAAYQCPSLLHISAASSVPPHQCPPLLPHQCSL
ncbi:unnamed protein product [Staurois parvus]|uniref:Uncharacterized protein n=1 Tax=Staurois parvus TaxID=386267 RepID=A0ABN9FGL1_9NEOB|nr:unnamed protein product [Staurois parvus]